MTKGLQYNYVNHRFVLRIVSFHDVIYHGLLSTAINGTLSDFLEIWSFRLRNFYEINVFSILYLVINMTSSKLSNIVLCYPYCKVEEAMQLIFLLCKLHDVEMTWICTSYVLEYCWHVDIRSGECWVHICEYTRVYESTSSKYYINIFIRVLHYKIKWAFSSGWSLFR